MLHGDNVQIGSHGLLAIDAESAGHTQVLDEAHGDESGSGLPEAGRLLGLKDGREYAIGPQLVIGRDAAADIVVSDFEVSRQHATLRATPAGYQLTDDSANGTYVNGIRMGRTRLLAHGDVLRIGTDEFRFDAGADTGFVPPPSGATYRLSDTMHGMPAAALRRPTPAGVVVPALASFLIRHGTGRGERLQVKGPAVDIGRADHNDVVFSDPSVSLSHAKLQWRDGIWMLADAGSMNGTYVDNEPVRDETPLVAGVVVRFGEVAALFDTHDEPTAAMLEAHPAAAAASPVAGLVSDEPRPQPEVVPAADSLMLQDAAETLAELPEAGPERPLRARPAPQPRRGIPAWLIIATLVAAALGVAAGFLLLQ